MSTQPSLGRRLISRHVDNTSLEWAIPSFGEHCVLFKKRLIDWRKNIWNFLRKICGFDTSGRTSKQNLWLNALAKCSRPTSEPRSDVPQYNAALRRNLWNVPGDLLGNSKKPLRRSEKRGDFSSESRMRWGCVLHDFSHTTSEASQPVGVKG